MSAEEWRPAITPEELRARFPAINNARVMDPRASSQVCAIDRAEQITKRVWTNLAFADVFLAGVPAMRTRADAAADDFHRRAACDACARAQGDMPVLHYDTGDTDYDPNATWEQGALRIWQVGTNLVHIVRERWHDSPNRKPTAVGYAAGLLAHKVDTHDYWNCRCVGDCDLRCNVQLAEGCSGTTRLLPVDRGTLMLLFRCCWPCEAALIGALPAPVDGT